MASLASRQPAAWALAVKRATARADDQGVEQSERWSGAVDVLRLVALGYLAAAASLLFWSHAPQVVGWQPRVVLTGSMMPTVRPGDVAPFVAAAGL